MPDFRKSSHLPNLRADGQPPHPSWLPRQRVGTSPQMIGRYPDFDVMSAVDTWDHATTKVVLKRLEPTVAMRFFDAEQEATLRAFCDVVLAQDREPRVPVAESIDEKMATGQLDGYQYADMPDDRDTWKAALRGLDHAACERGADSFAAATLQDQEAVVEDFAGGTLRGGPWEQMDPSRTWSVCMRAVLSGFYSHPWAWNEIGFGGPAYPRGYMRLGPTSTTEPFETHGSTNENPSDVVRGNS